MDEMVVVAETRGKLCKLAREACQQLQGAARDVGGVVCGGPVSGRVPLTRSAGISRTLQDCLVQLVAWASRSLLGFRVLWVWIWLAGLERESDLQRGMAADEQCNARNASARPSRACSIDIAASHRKRRMKYNERSLNLGAINRSRRIGKFCK